ncbi:MAG: pseudouridine-5'-phosphate glycosidase [Trueperaceae bacterium]|nr:MAG: pseudouridine-5'-phosphate glycosidase [Trueperaceae bacterium]
MSLRIAPHIQDALRQGRPVVALESTAITHGLPQPANLELAVSLEQEIRNGGAVPATVAVLSGKLVVGLDSHELEYLAMNNVGKASLWNLATLLANGEDAGTTVASTLHAATMAGISVFATGGIGGVHDHPYDESADLHALARYRVITICAGPKSILDVSATLERLESLGVPILAYRSDYLAGFYVPETPFRAPARCENPEDIARAFLHHTELRFKSAMLVCKPVSQGLTHEEFKEYLDETLKVTETENLRGKDTTPILLNALAEISQGHTLEVNLRLLRENARLAARVATSLQRLTKRDLDPVGVSYERLSSDR